MKKYNVVSNGEVLLKGVTGTMEEIGVLTAMMFGEKYFGCNICQTPDSLTEKQIANKWGPDFSCIAVKEYFERDLKIVNPNPIEIAARSLAMHIAFQNGIIIGA